MVYRCMMYSPYGFVVLEHVYVEQTLPSHAAWACGGHIRCMLFWIHSELQMKVSSVIGLASLLERRRPCLLARGEGV